MTLVLVAGRKYHANTHLGSAIGKYRMALDYDTDTEVGKQLGEVCNIKVSFEILSAQKL